MRERHELYFYSLNEQKGASGNRICKNVLMSTSLCHVVHGHVSSSQRLSLRCSCRQYSFILITFPFLAFAALPFDMSSYVFGMNMSHKFFKLRDFSVSHIRTVSFFSIFLSSCHSSLTVIGCWMISLKLFFFYLKKEMRKSYTGSGAIVIPGRRSVSPIPSLPSTPSSHDASSEEEGEEDVFSGERNTVRTINVPSGVKSSSYTHTSPSRILLEPPSSSSGDFNRNNKSVVGSNSMTSSHHPSHVHRHSSIRSSKSGSEGDPVSRTPSSSRPASRPSSFSRVSPSSGTTIRVPSKTVVNRTLS